MKHDLRVRLIRTGLCGSGLLCFPPFVLVHQLGQVRSLLGVADDQFVLEQFFGCWPLRGGRRADFSKVVISGTIGPLNVHVCVQNWALC